MGWLHDKDANTAPPAPEEGPTHPAKEGSASGMVIEHAGSSDVTTSTPMQLTKKQEKTLKHLRK